MWSIVLQTCLTCCNTHHRSPIYDPHHEPVSSSLYSTAFLSSKLPFLRCSFLHGLDMGSLVLELFVPTTARPRNMLALEASSQQGWLHLQPRIQRSCVRSAGVSHWPGPPRWQRSSTPYFEFLSYLSINI